MDLANFTDLTGYPRVGINVDYLCSKDTSWFDKRAIFLFE
jgi:hypothetical protein